MAYAHLDNPRTQQRDSSSPPMTKTWITILVFVLVIAGTMFVMSRDAESFSASDDSIEMRIDVAEFQTQEDAINALLEPTGALQSAVDRCKEMNEWMCGALAFQESRFDDVLQKQAVALSPSSTATQQAYVDRLKLKSWTAKMDPTLECFADRHVPVDQQRATSRLERSVILLEEFMRGSDVQAAKGYLAKVARGLAVLAGTPFPPPMTLADLYSQGACPSGMFEFGTDNDPRCCPVEPVSYDTKTHTFTRCPLEKLGTEVTCALTNTTDLPTCRPQPIQGPCLPDYFFFAASKGGRCCPVPPTGYDSDRGEYTTCSKVAKAGRTLCALSKNTEGIPVCAEGFQTQGRTLLLRADAVREEAQRFVGDVAAMEKRIATFQLPEPLTSQALTFSPGISRSSPSP